LTAVNRAARRLFRTDDMIVDAAGALGEAVAEATPETRKTVRLAAGGLPRTYALSVADVTGAGGALRLAALTDIQAELQAAEAAALKALLQVLSHEIMNTLTPLASLAQSAADLLEEEGPEPRRRLVSLTAVLEEAASLFASRWIGVQLSVEPPRPDVMLRLDPDLTAQA